MPPAKSLPLGKNTPAQRSTNESSTLPPARPFEAQGPAQKPLGMTRARHRFQDISQTPLQMAPGDEAIAGRTRSKKKKPPAKGKKPSLAKRPAVPRQTAVKFATWNAGHLSEENQHRDKKLEHLSQMITDQQPDVLSLQEINSDISQHLQEAAGDDYELHMGPFMEAGANSYNDRQGTQYEYYPLLVKKSAGLKVTHLGMTHVEGGNRASGKKKETEAWGSARPMATYLMTHKATNRSAILGAAHTSPGSHVEKQIKEHYQALNALSQKMDMPFFGMGDWYGKENKGIPKKHIKRSSTSTNYAEDQDDNRAAADYFLTNLQSSNLRVHDDPEELFREKISDHSSVSVTARLKNRSVKTHAQLANEATGWADQINQARFLGQSDDEQLAQTLGYSDRRRSQRILTKRKRDLDMDDDTNQALEPQKKKAKRR